MLRVRWWWIGAALFVVIAIALGWSWFSGPFWLGPEGRYFDSNGVSIHYTDEGKGEPVVLVHGFAATGQLNWRFTGVVDELAKQFRVIAIDVRGHGRSGKPTDAGAYGVEMGEDVIRLLDHLGIQRAHVAGYSMGGFITLHLLTRHPERILRAAVCGFGWQRPDPSALNVYDLLGNAFDHGFGFSAMASFVNPGAGIGPVRAALTDLIAGQLLDRRAMAAVARSLKGLTVTEAALRAVNVPVLSVIGTADPLLPGVQALTDVLPHHEIVLIEGGTHRYTPRDPRFRTALRRWFSGEDPVRPSASGDVPEPAVGP